MSGVEESGLSQFVRKSLERARVDGVWSSSRFAAPVEEATSDRTQAELRHPLVLSLDLRLGALEKWIGAFGKKL